MVSQHALQRWVCAIQACLAAGGGVPARGGCAWSGWPVGNPPGRLLLRAVRILLECILVYGINLMELSTVGNNACRNVV